MAKRHFGSIHAKHTWASAWRAHRRNHFIARQKAKLHEPARDILGEFEMVENTALSHREVGKRLYGWSSAEPHPDGLGFETHTIYDQFSTRSK